MKRPRERILSSLQERIKYIEKLCREWKSQLSEDEYDIWFPVLELLRQCHQQMSQDNQSFLALQHLVQTSLQGPATSK